MNPRVILARADRVVPRRGESVSLTRAEWRQLASLAAGYGWKGVPDAPRLSAAEASDLAAALARARYVPVQLRDVTAQVIPIARTGGLNLWRAE